MLKYHDEFITDFSLESTDWVELTPSGSDNMLQIEEGTGPKKRLGKHIDIHQINMKYQVGGDLDDKDLKGGLFTLAVVLDTQTNKAAPNTDDIWDTTFPHELSFRDLEHSTRFRVLYRKTLAMTVMFVSDENLTTAAERSQLRQKHGSWYYKPRRPIRIQYDDKIGTTGTIDEQTVNSIHVFIATDVTTAAISFQASWRVRFSDHGYASAWGTR